MLTSIIIVNHNTGEVLKKCIDSVYRYEDERCFDVMIVDNGSTDNSAELIREIAAKHGNIKHIGFERIESFSYANNRGIELTSGEYVLIMNPDIIFTEPLLKRLTDVFSRNKEVGGISPALIGQDGNFQRNYFQRYPSLMQFFLFHSLMGKISSRSPRLMNRYLENQEIDINTGNLITVQQIPCAFFFTSRAVLDETGLMDEKFVLFFEDMDLSYRMGKKFSLAVDTALKVTHLGGASFKYKDDWQLYGRFIISMIYFFDKHYGKTRGFLLKIISIANSLLVLFWEFIKKLFMRPDPNRIKKHKYFINLFKQNYL